MSTIAALPPILMSGLKCGRRVGSMHRLGPLWGPRSRNMQRWGAKQDHAIRIISYALIIYYHVGWRSTGLGMWLSEDGVCVLTTLPLGIVCNMVIKLNHDMVQFVLSAAVAGHTDIDPECPVWGSYI